MAELTVLFMTSAVWRNPRDMRPDPAPKSAPVGVFDDGMAKPANGSRPASAR